MATATKQKKKHIKAVRPKLRLFRANEPLYSVLMWGINHSVGFCIDNNDNFHQREVMKRHGSEKSIGSGRRRYRRSARNYSIE